MIATWMLYALGLAAAVSAVTLAAEYALRLYGRSTRWLWATSLVAVLALPLLSWVLTAPPAPVPVAGVGEVLPVALAPVAAAPAAPVPVSAWSRLASLERRLDGELPWVWLGTSVLAALALALSYARLRRQRRGWAAGEVDGIPVLVSDGVGPAVVGLRRARIVVPDWVLTEPESRRRLILAHEAEHLAAGDARLLTGALAVLVAAPWNPLVWWQIRRLRLAAEVDCDARVLRRGADLRGYAGLLLDVGMRFGEGGALAAFAEPRSLLARRLRALTAPLPRRRGWRVAALALTGAAVAALACVAPRPDKPLPTEPVGPVQAVVADTPSYTPYTVAPELTNRDEVRRAILESYPPLLRNAGIGGYALIWLHIDREGRVASARIKKTTEQAALDSAALHVGRMMQFKPALNGSAPADVWVALPITFFPKGGNQIVSPEDSTLARKMGMMLPPRGVRQELPPGVIAPEMTHEEQAAFARELSAAYPPLLKAAGIGGTAWLRLHIDERGAVTAAPVVGSSGHAELDAAAAKMALGMHFVPARDSATGQARAVDLVLPLPFRASAAAPREAPPAAAASAPAAVRQDTFDVPPKVLNRDEILAAAQRFAATVQRAESPPVVRMRVDERGNVTSMLIERTSGLPEADSAALAVARVMRFSPATRQGKPVPAWFAWGQPAAPPTPEQIRKGPVFTPYTVAPELTNRDDVRQALIREYPPDLKAAGVGDTTQLWILVDKTGAPLRVSVKKASRYPSLDSAAVRVAQVIRFTPAQNVDQPVEVWITLPIIFKSTPPAPPARPDTQRTQPAAAPRARTAAVAALTASSWVLLMHH